MMFTCKMSESQCHATVLDSLLYFSHRLRLYSEVNSCSYDLCNNSHRISLHCIYQSYILLYWAIFLHAKHISLIIYNTLHSKINTVSYTLAKILKKFCFFSHKIGDFFSIWEFFTQICWRNFLLKFARGIFYLNLLKFSKF